jgi:hypothetical protein
VRGGNPDPNLSRSHEATWFSWRLNGGPGSGCAGRPLLLSVVQVQVTDSVLYEVSSCLGAVDCVRCGEFGSGSQNREQVPWYCESSVLSLSSSSAQLAPRSASYTTPTLAWYG